MTDFGLHKFFDFSRILNRRSREHFCSQSDFNIILKNERERSNRNGKPFALIIFEPLDVGMNDRSKASLFRSIISRVRSIDAAGWIDKDKIGVILIGATREGANVFVEAVKRMNGNITKTVFSHIVLIYPDANRNNIFL